MSQFTPPPNLPPNVPPNAPPAAPRSDAQPTADVRFELVEALLAERAQGGSATAGQLIAVPVKQLEALRGQVQDTKLDSALKGFAAVDQLLTALAGAKTDAPPIPPV